MEVQEGSNFYLGLKARVDLLPFVLHQVLFCLSIYSISLSCLEYCVEKNSEAMGKNAMFNEQCHSKARSKVGNRCIICRNSICPLQYTWNFTGNFSLKAGSWEEYKILLDSSLNIILLVNIDFLWVSLSPSYTIFLPLFYFHPKIFNYSSYSLGTNRSLSLVRVSSTLWSILYCGKFIFKYSTVDSVIYKCVN